MHVHAQDGLDSIFTAFVAKTKELEARRSLARRLSIAAPVLSQQMKVGAVAPQRMGGWTQEHMQLGVCVCVSVHRAHTARRASTAAPVLQHKLNCVPPNVRAPALGMMKVPWLWVPCSARIHTHMCAMMLEQEFELQAMSTRCTQRVLVVASTYLRDHRVDSCLRLAHAHTARRLPG